MTLTGSVHAVVVALVCLGSAPEEYPPTRADTGKDGRVTTQTTTQMYKEQN